MRREETSARFPPGLRPSSSAPSTVSSHGRRARSRRTRTQRRWTAVCEEGRAVNPPMAHRCICSMTDTKQPFFKKNKNKNTEEISSKIICCLRKGIQANSVDTEGAVGVENKQSTSASNWPPHKLSCLVY